MHAGIVCNLLVTHALLHHEGMSLACDHRLRTAGDLPTGSLRRDILYRFWSPTLDCRRAGPEGAAATTLLQGSDLHPGLSVPRYADCMPKHFEH
jgi:hypothetical protein